jgi:cytochrome b6-f complex iron-sulfur subunit
MGDEEAREVGRGEGSLDRRSFLSWSWRALGVALVVEAGWTSYDLLNPPASGNLGGLVDAGPVDEYLTEGTVQYFLDGRFYVTQYQGGLRALYQKCPHLGCRVPFCDSSGQFECPCHGSVYNLIGEYLRGPAPRGMDRFPIQIKGDHVFVDTSTVIQGPPRGTLQGPGPSTGPSCLNQGAPAPGGSMPGGSMPGGSSEGASA